jgi:hypothetical protein
MGYLIERLSFGGILDQGFRLLRDHFKSLTVGFVLIYAPYTALNHYIGVGQGETVPSAGQLIAFMVLTLLLLAIMPLMQVTVTIAIADAYLSRPTSFGAAFARARKLFLPYLGTFFLVMFALMGLFLLLIVPGLIFSGYWMLIGPVAVIEGVFGGAAMKRSRALVRGYWWRAVGVAFVSTLLVSLVSGALDFVFSFIPVVGPLLSGVVSGVTATYAAAVIVVLYVDLRCRHEDFDVQLLAQQVAQGSLPPQANAAE